MLPDGRVARVTYGLINLAHRDGHEHLAALEPGRRVRVRLALREIAQAFPAGHRIRLALSTGYWPIAWPAPRQATLTIHGAGSALLLPVRPPRPEDAALVAFAPVETAPPTPTTVLRPPRIERFARSDEATGETDYAILRDDGAVRIEATGTVIETRKDLRYRVHASDPDRTRAEADVVYAMSRADWRPRLVSRGVLTGDAGHFRLHTTIDAYDGDTRVFSRSWSQRIARDHV